MDKKHRNLLGVLSLVVATTCAVAGEARSSAAFVELRMDGARMLYTTQRLQRGAHVVAQYPDSRGQPLCCVSLKVLGARASSHRVSDLRFERPVFAYALPGLPVASALPFVGAALVGSSRSERKPAMPTVCASSEGLHLLQRSAGKPRAHLYMELGYGAQPSCDEGLLAQFD
jgi:hypothetical protein